MTQINWPFWMLSSTGEGLSKKITGFFTTAIPAVVLLSQLFGHPILEADLTSVSNAITLGIGAIWTIFGVIMTIAGIARDNFNKENQLGKYSPAFLAARKAK